MREHVEVKAAQGGAVGIKDMLFGDLRRLSVRGPGAPVVEPDSFLVSLYLHRDECQAVAEALLPESMVAIRRDDLAGILDAAVNQRPPFPPYVERLTARVKGAT